MKLSTAVPSLLAVLSFIDVIDAQYNATNSTSSCDTLWSFTGNQEASTDVRTVNHVPYNSTTDVPAFCNVTGYINGYTGFWIVLPADSSQYVGVLTVQGCGGSCGTYQMFANHPIFATDQKPNGEGTAPALLRRGYIASMTNMGHDNSDYPIKYSNVTSGSTCYTCAAASKSANVGSWTPFRNNHTNEINFGYLSTHLVTVMGKEMAAYYYGSKPKYSYFVGGSTGGRQGLVAAQKYPMDFTGISAGQPPLNETFIGAVLFNYLIRKNFDANGNPILSIADAATMNLTALASCDHLDGLVDGMIDNADLCTIDWSLVTCGSDTTMFNETTCFNPTKLAVAQALYDVPRMSDGTPLSNVNLHFLPGSEAGWVNEGYVGSNKSASFLWSFAEEFNKYAAYEVDKPDSWSLDSFNFDTDPFMMKYMESIFYSQNTDLTEFKKAGGKFLLMHSWSDPEVPVGYSLDWYSRVRRTMGGQQKTDDFLRMFLMPGMWHVWGYGPGATSGQDVYKTLSDWCEKGVAPHSITGTKYLNGVAAYSRPSYAFPYYAKYDGIGNWRNASSWGPQLRPSDLDHFEADYIKP